MSLDALIGLIIYLPVCRDGGEMRTHHTQSFHTEFAIDQMVMVIKEWLHALRKASDQREKEAEFSCVSFHPIYFKADTVFFSMELPLWNTERVRGDKRTLDSYFLVPSAWQNKIICSEVTGALTSSPQEPSISFIRGILFSSRRYP